MRFDHVSTNMKTPSDRTQGQCKIFVWKDGLDYDKQEANRFVLHILKFLSVASKKYSKVKFAVMLSDNGMIEHKYNLSFKTMTRIAGVRLWTAAAAAHRLLL
jgi:hypothetical protein